MSPRRISLARILAVATAAVFFATACYARTLTIQDFNEHVEVGANGAIDVTESIEIRFTGSWNGIYRKIPVK